MTSKAIMAQNTFKYNRTGRKASVKKKIAMVICGLFIGAVNGLFGACAERIASPITAQWHYLSLVCKQTRFVI